MGWKYFNIYARKHFCVETLAIMKITNIEK